MSLFAIADTHLSLGDDKPMDIFPGWDDYVRRLENNWRELVKDQDTVVIAGDISWAMSLENTAADFSFLNSLPGKKLLFKGNHDYWWTTRRKIELFFEEKGFNTLKIIHNSTEICGDYAICGSRGWFYEAASKNTGGQKTDIPASELDQKIILREAGRLEASIVQAEKTGLEPIVFLHYPPFFGDVICGEMMEVLRRHRIRLCYYGHLHGAGARKIRPREIDGVFMRLISCDAVDFTPVLVR